MNPGLLFLAGVTAGSLLTWGLQLDRYDRCRRLLALVTKKRQASRDERERLQVYLRWSCEEHAAARRARDEACSMLGKAEVLERQVFVASLN